MSLGQSGCAGGFIPLPAVIVQAVAEPPMGCTGGRCTAYVFLSQRALRRAPVHTKISGDLVNLPAQA